MSCDFFYRLKIIHFPKSVYLLKILFWSSLNLIEILIFYLICSLNRVFRRSWVGLTYRPQLVDLLHLICFNGQHFLLFSGHVGLATTALTLAIVLSKWFTNPKPFPIFITLFFYITLHSDIVFAMQTTTCFHFHCFTFFAKSQNCFEHGFKFYDNLYFSDTSVMILPAQIDTTQFQ